MNTGTPTMTTAMAVADNAERTVFALALLDLPADVVETWWAHGFRDPTLVRDLHDRQIPAGIAAGLRDARVPNEHIAGHYTAGIFPAVATVLADSGITDPEDQRVTVRTGVPAVKIAAYARAGVRGYEAMLRAYRSGLLPADFDTDGW